MRTSAALVQSTSDALTQVFNDRGPADQSLSRYFREHRELGQQDRAYVAETVSSVLRRRRSLACAAQSEAPRALVLAAMIRLQGMSVRVVSDLVREKDKPLLDSIRGARAEAWSRAVQLDLPDWLWDRLVADHGEEEAGLLARGMLDAAPMDLRVNSMKGGREDVMAALSADGLEVKATPYSPIGIRVAGRPAVNRHGLYLGGTIEVQDEGSQLLSLMLAPRRGEMVVDFCAGAGGKTLALGAMMRSSGRLYAFDVSAKRLAAMAPRLARSGLSNVHPVAIANENDPRAKRLAGKIDRVLVDAPCSGFGTLRRNPDLKWRHGEKDVTELAAKQLRILEAASRLLKTGGRIVFATCSVLREEGEAVADAFVASHPHFKELSCEELLAAQGTELACGMRLRLFPHREGTDGFFAAAFERKA